MAGVSDAVSESGGEEGDYESDSDGTSTLALRRRAASDDEEDEAGHRRARAGEGVEAHLTQDAASSFDGEISRIPYSDEEEEDDEEVDDGEGAPPLYEEDEEEELLLEEEGHERGAPLTQLMSRRRRKGSDEEEEDDDVARHDEEEGSAGGSKRGESLEIADGGAATGAKEVNEEEKKEAEPFVVPTAGAFYMHDDRFRDNGGARPRRSMGGRKLWESKDEKPWVHDMFEELDIGHDNFAAEGFQRAGKGRGRGRGRGRARGRGGVGRLTNNEESGGMRSRTYGRGRGPRGDAAESVREDGSGAANYAARILNEADATSGTDQSGSAQGGQHQENAVLKKAASGSYLNSASPPFIPSGVLQQKLAGRPEGPGEVESSPGQVQSKGREQYGPGLRNSSSRTNPETAGASKSASGAGRGSGSGAQSSGIVWSQSDSVLATTSPQQTAKSAVSSVNQQQKLEGKMQNHQSVSRPLVTPPSNQSGRTGASLNQTASFVRTSQAQGQPTPSNPRLSSQAGSGGVGNNSVLASNNLRFKGNGGGRAARLSTSGRGSYMFAGTPNSALRVGDPGFQSSPAVGPVAVQYGGQSPGGMGVPAVGMPMPNYPYGFPNSEVTWVPVLAGGGAMGASYGAPYIAMEGAPSHMYYTSATAQPAPGYHVTGRDMNGVKHQPPGGLWKPPPNPELGTDEFGQRQSKPRRYSEMNFGQ